VQSAQLSGALEWSMNPCMTNPCHICSQRSTSVSAPYIITMSILCTVYNN
jgi:hypothetical protein